MRRSPCGGLACEYWALASEGDFVIPIAMLRRVLLLAAALLAPVVTQGAERLEGSDVQLIVAQAATRAHQFRQNAIIAVTDREGFVLALWDVGHNLPAQLPPFALTWPVLKVYSLAGAAITRASTAAFLSSDQNAFTSRTAGYIIQQHFPPGIRNTPNGPLVGVGFSSLFYTDVNRAKLLPPGFSGNTPIASTISPGIRAPAFPLTSLDDSPGGVPLYKNGYLVGGIGVTGDGYPTNLLPAGAIFFNQTQRDSTTGFETGDDTDEDIALAGQTHYRPPGEILATNVLINGIRIPYTFPEASQIEDVEGTQALGTYGNAVAVPYGGDPTIPYAAGVAPNLPQGAPAEYPYEPATLGQVEGEICFPLRDDPVAAIPGRERIGNATRLQKNEVKNILALAAERAQETRAGIRLPIGTSAKAFIAVVNNPYLAGEAPQILGVFRTGDATIFSWDVAVQKARTAVFFSNRQLAMSPRTVGFLAQRFFPPGLDGQPWGPFFGFQEAISLRMRPLADQARGAPAFPGNPNLPNGMTIFPGGFPLYRNGYLVGAIGVSGDGVDQDDIVAASGCADFLADQSIRADSYTYRGARLPYAKFPRDPEQ